MSHIEDQLLRENSLTNTALLAGCPYRHAGKILRIRCALDLHRAEQISNAQARKHKSRHGLM